MPDGNTRGFCRGLGQVLLVAAIVVACGIPRAAPAQSATPDRCPGVADLLRLAPSQDVDLDIFAYRPGAVAERLRLCRTRAGDNWFDPAEEPRRQAMGLMFEWAGAFSCALTEYASAPSVLGRPLNGPRVTYLREAAFFEGLRGTIEAYADLRDSPPLDHFRAVQLLVKIQSRWNRSSESDHAELIAREAGGDPHAVMALATLAFEIRPEPAAFDHAIRSLTEAGRRGSVRALELGAQYAEMAARWAGAGDGGRRYGEIRRALLAQAAYRGSPTAITALVRTLELSDVVDDAMAAPFWDAIYRGVARDLEEVSSACR